MLTSNRPPESLIWATWITLGVLVLALPLGIASIPSLVDQLVVLLTHLEPLKVPLSVVAMAFGVCVEAMLVVTGVLVGYIRYDQIFSPIALRWVDVLVGAALAATLCVIASLFFVPGPPQLFALVEVSVLMGAAITLVLLVMRALLRRAASMHVELEEVV